MIKKYVLLLIIMLSSIVSATLAEDYSAEFKNAYKYAYEKWITTMDSISKANMYWSITRIEMAKMISEFSIDVLWLQLDKTKDCNFYDVSSDLDKQYAYWVTKVCQLWLMWIYDDWTRSDYFNPKRTVTRWEWATILSRAIRLSERKSVIKNGDPFYKPHINFLFSKWIVISYDNPSPKSEEKRWNVMSMLFKSEQDNIILVNYATWYTKLKPNQIYYNKYYWIQFEHYGNYPCLVEILPWEIRFYSFIPEKYWDYKLYSDYIGELKENAKFFNEEWLLIHIESWEFTKKWLDDYESVIEWLEDQSTSINPTSKWYIIYQEPWMSIQEPPYEYFGKENMNPYDYWGKFREVVWDFTLIEK